MSGRFMVALAVCFAWACSDEAPGPGGQDDRPDSWDLLWEGGDIVDTLGTMDLSEADTVSGHSGLTCIETTVTFPAEASDPTAEVFAWEFHARSLSPVKLIIVRYDRELEQYELMGEGKTVIPRRLGLNRFVLPEPVPVAPGYRFGLVMPGKETVGFRVVRNWRTLIRTQGLERPYMRRDSFATYGWRYAARVFWRRTPASTEEVP